MTDNYDKLLDVLSTPDWITPLWGIIQELRHPNGLALYISRHNAFSLADAKRTLDRHNIEHWNDFILDDDWFVLHVNPDDAERAEQLINNTTGHNPFAIYFWYFVLLIFLLMNGLLLGWIL